MKVVAALGLVSTGSALLTPPGSVLKPMLHRHKPVVVVTGTGGLTPLGGSVAQTWQDMRAGRSGISRISRFDTEQPFPCPVKVAGEVNADFSTITRNAASAKNFGNTALLATLAADEAMLQAGLLELDELGQPLVIDPEGAGCPESLQTRDLDLSRAGTFVGTCMAETEAIAQAALQLERTGKMPTRTNILSLGNMPNWAVNSRYQFQGEGVAPSGACATSIHAIGMGKKAIELGELDIALVGGADYSVTPYNVNSFVAAKALQTGFEDAPEKACQPWNKGRGGFVIADGAGVMVIERLGHALARGVPPENILAVVEGYGSSSDGYHPTKPRRDGRGNSLAQIKALEDAGIEPKDIGFVYAHATGTPLGDCIELRGLTKTWGEFGQGLTKATPIYAPKSALGHTLGAAGGIASIGAICSLRDQVVPQTLNFESFDEQGMPFKDLNLATDGPQTLDNVRYGMVNALGFGGTNAAVILGKYGHTQ